MTVKQINLSWVVVADLAKAKKYFTEVVGLKVNNSQEEYGWVELVGHDGGSLLGLAQANNSHEPMMPGENAVVGFSVENIEKAKDAMAKKGATFIGDILEVPGIVKLQLFKDMDGNKFQIVEDLENK